MGVEITGPRAYEYLYTEEEKREYFNVINDIIELFEIKHISYGGLLKEFGLEDIKKYVLPNFPNIGNAI